MSVLMTGWSIGPYYGVTHDVVCEKGGKRWRIIVYGAYNAYGLIGGEHNGVAVFDETTEEVILDKLDAETTGYYGPSDQQVWLFNKLVEMNWDEFRTYVNGRTDRLRHAI